jgi:hypothetical protein
VNYSGIDRLVVKSNLFHLYDSLLCPFFLQKLFIVSFSLEFDSSFLFKYPKLAFTIYLAMFIEVEMTLFCIAGLVVQFVRNLYALF